MSPKRDRAFTLIELLVVISLVTLLVAILQPALQNARTASQATQGLTNLRQLQVALHAYAGDFKDSLPFSRNWDYIANNPGTGYWGQRLHTYKYVFDVRVFWSPAHNPLFNNGIPPTLHGFTLSQMQSNSAAAWATFAYTGYAVNTRGAMPQENNASNAFPFKLSTTRQHSQVLTLVDNAKNNHNVPNPGRVGENLMSYNGGVGTAFLDGHAAQLSSEIGWVVTGPLTGTWLNSGQNDPAWKLNPWFNQFP